MEPRLVVDRKSEAAIFARVVDRSLSRLAPELARSLLDLGFSEDDHARVHELTARNQDDALSPDEKEELMNYVKVGNLLALVQSRARTFLKERVARLIGDHLSHGTRA